MASSEVPSFSLGLDETPPHSPIDGSPSPSSSLHVSDSDPEPRPDQPRPILKRLRRGPLPPSLDPDADDDIEGFSSQDDPDQVCTLLSAWNRNHSVCGSSKVSLNGSGVLTPHSCSNSSRDRKRKEPSGDVPASARLETGKSGLMFPKLTTSPLRRFQLLDSDSDNDDSGGGANKVNPNNHLQQDKKTSVDVNGNKDLWKDFSPVKNDSFNRFQLLSDSDDSDVDVGGANKANPKTHLEQNKKTSLDEYIWKDFSPLKNVFVATPAFNEVCEEYFRSAKCKEVGGVASKSYNEMYPGVSSSCQRDQQQRQSTDLAHPAHSYFFHEDLRIRQLVCSRLRNFNPLGNQQPNVSHIDYMGQFSNGGASNMQGVQNGCDNSSTRRKNKSALYAFDAHRRVEQDSRNQKRKQVPRRQMPRRETEHLMAKHLFSAWSTSHNLLVDLMTSSILEVPFCQIVLNFRYHVLDANKEASNPAYAGMQHLMRKLNYGLVA